MLGTSGHLLTSVWPGAPNGEEQTPKASRVVWQFGYLEAVRDKMTGFGTSVQGAESLQLF